MERKFNMEIVGTWWEIWRETWYVDKHMYLNQAKCELKKGSIESHIAKNTFGGSVYI
jgi:hypothetical protein